MKWDSWVARCCDVLEQRRQQPAAGGNNNATSLDQDRTLVWLVRLQHIATDINELNRSCRKAGAGIGANGNDSLYGGKAAAAAAAAAPSEHHLKLIRLGLETQLREWQKAIPERVATTRMFHSFHPPTQSLTPTQASNHGAHFVSFCFIIILHYVV